MLRKQEEQEMTIKKCRNKVDCMTDEMKMFQRITTEDATPKQVSNRLAWTNELTVKINSFSYCFQKQVPSDQYRNDSIWRPRAKSAPSVIGTPFLISTLSNKHLL